MPKRKLAKHSTRPTRLLLLLCYIDREEDAFPPVIEIFIRITHRRPSLPLLFRFPKCLLRQPLPLYIQDMASGWVKLCKERAIPVADDFSLEGEPIP